MGRQHGIPAAGQIQPSPKEVGLGGMTKAGQFLWQQAKTALDNRVWGNSRADEPSACPDSMRVGGRL